jgi:endonuclease YncB( thermonuclease family)
MSKFRFLALALLVLSSAADATSEVQRHFLAGRDTVLDGDTLLIDGHPVRIAEIDAPELGPWARCWAEAALAGHAKHEVERLLAEGEWRLVDVGAPDAGGRRSARVVGAGSSGDLADNLVVGGFAARTTGRWDWCGRNANLHDPRDDEPVPHGPDLWWPSGHMFDPRADD